MWRGTALLHVYSCELARSVRDACAQFRRLEHFIARTRAKHGVMRLGERLEDERPLAVAGTHGHFDAREAVFERARPLLPERAELELLRPLELLVQRPHRCDSRYAVDAHARRAVCDEVPRAALEH